MDHNKINPGPSGSQMFKNIPDANLGPSGTQSFPTAQQVDQDENCRLIHGLNKHCLAESFQYLNDEELSQLGIMNEYYVDIINNYVIPDHAITIDYFKNRQHGEILLEKYGKQIKRFRFLGKPKRHYESFLRRIVRYCDVDQLREISFNISELGGSDRIPVNVNAAIDHFRKVQRFYFQGLSYKPTTLNLPQFESLRLLDLYKVDMDPKFNWNNLFNLTDLSLARVKGINIENFINFIRRQPRLRRFVHMNTFEDIQQIGTELANNCGIYMRVFRDIIEYEFVNGRIVYKKRTNYTYRFLSDFVRLRDVLLVSDLICACDLKEPMARLSQNNDLEKLTIIQILSGQGDPADCFVSNYFAYNLKCFNKLKSIHLHVRGGTGNGTCKYMKLFTEYSAQIMTNVEIITLSGSNKNNYNMEFIMCAHKLRILSIYNSDVTMKGDEALTMVTIISAILEQRLCYSATAPPIQVIVNQVQWKEFQKLGNIDPHIKFELQNPNVFEYPDIVQSFWNH